MINETELPPSVDETPEQPEVETSLEPSVETPVEKPSIVDLDTLDKFKFGGREWTQKELKAAYMMQSDYSKKTQEIAQERKYHDNLIYDLKSVRANPNLVQQFKQVYPQKYHAYVDELLGKFEQSPQQSAQTPTSVLQQLPPEFMELRGEIEAFKKERFDAEVAKHTADLDRIMTTMEQKYPFADQEVVLARAEHLIASGQKIDEKMWDGLFKVVNDKSESFYKQRNAEMIKKQKEASAKAKDVAIGGGTPGAAPRQFKTIKEASEAARRDFAS